MRTVDEEDGRGAAATAHDDDDHDDDGYADAAPEVATLLRPSFSSPTTTPTTSTRRRRLSSLVVVSVALLGALGGALYPGEVGWLLSKATDLKSGNKVKEVVVVGGGGGRRWKNRTSASASDSTTVPPEDDSSSSSSSSTSSLPSSSWWPTPDHDENSNSNNGSRSLPLCDRQQIVDGRWDPVHLPKAPYQPPRNYTNRCVPFDAFLNPKGWDTYQWVPNPSMDPAATGVDGGNSSAVGTETSNSSSRCHFTPWDAEKFCQIAQYSTVLIVGDSLSWEHYVSLVMLLGVQIHHGYQDVSRLRHVNIGHAVCSGRTRIVYRRDDDLSQLGRAIDDRRESNATLPQILVLNRGAHYATDDKYLKGLQLALDVVETWLQKCDTMNLTCHFFWRTTVPGHAHCRNFTKPVNNLQTMEAYISNVSNYDSETIQYHWPDFAHQNQLAEQELESRKSRLRYRVLDGYRLNVLRPDAHTDCLHSCNPGKMDVYPQLMLHYLRGDRTLEDVDRLRRVVEENHWYLNVSTKYGHV